MVETIAKTKRIPEIDHFIKHFSLSQFYLRKFSEIVQDDFYDTDEEPISFFSERLSAYNRKYNAHVKYLYGATKIVFIIPGSKYVLKIPLFQPSGLNYLDREIELYEEMDELGFSSFFVKTFYYKRARGINYYLQERIRVTAFELEEEEAEAEDNNNVISYNPSKESMSFVNSLYNESYESFCARSMFYRSWVAAAYDKYGEDKVYNFILYLSENFPGRAARVTKPIEYMINDMHENNYGYDYDNNPVIIDYSGYEEDY